MCSGSVPEVPYSTPRLSIIVRCEIGCVILAEIYVIARVCVCVCVLSALGPPAIVSRSLSHFRCALSIIIIII